ncbi:11348_t:CDS:1 [Rhizophagus irregularis]|nr:11348_t:CDS:1 [Rhizophagus irregularis]
MEYVIIGDIKELATTGIAGVRGISWNNSTASAPSDSKGIPSLKIIWDEVFFFNANWSLRGLFSSIKFDRAEYKASISQLAISCVATIPFSIHSIVYFFELRSSFAHSNSSLRDSISDELIWAGFSTTPPVASKS